MKGKKLQLLAASLALLVLTGVWLLLRNPAPEPPPSAGERSPLYVLQSAAKVRRAAISYEGDDFTLENLAENAASAVDAPVYSLRGLAEYPLDSTLISATLDMLSELPATRLLAENAAEFGKYGLTSPLFRAEISYYDGSSATLLVGGDAPQQEGVYVCVEGENDVYLVSNAPVSTLRRHSLGYISRRITGGGYASRLYRVALSGGGREESVVIEAVEPETADAPQSFRLTSPVEAAVGSEGLPVLRSVLGQLGEAYIVNPDADTLDALGLLNPYAAAEVECDEGSFTVYAAEPLPDGNVFMMNAARHVVYLADASNLPWITAAYPDFVSRVAASPRLDELSGLTIETSDGTYRFSVAGELGAIEARYGSTLLDAEWFANYYGTLISARRQEVAAQPLPEGAPLTLRVTYHYREGAEDTVAFYPGEAARRHYIVQGGLIRFYISSSHVERMLDDLQTLVADGEVRPYR